MQGPDLEKELICNSAARFFKRLIEEDPANQDARMMFLLAISMLHALEVTDYDNDLFSNSPVHLLANTTPSS